MQAGARRFSAVALAAAAAAAGAAVIPAARGADATPNADVLRRAEATYAAQIRAAELELYALEAQLERSRAELAAVRRGAEDVARRHAAARRQAALAHLQLDLANRLLAERLLALYVQGEADPLAILFGADSLGDAIDSLEGLATLAAQDSRLASQVRIWKRLAGERTRELARQYAALRQTEAAARSREAALAAARGEREAYVADLRDRRRLNAARIAAVERAVRKAREKTRTLTPVEAPTGGAAAPVSEVSGGTTPPAPVSGSRVVTVVATAYTLPGRTATGISVGWGVVAVDPSVIPLGTRMTIPGYGEGVAADVGSAIRGARIDLWFPTRGEALTWGQRTVTVTLH